MAALYALVLQALLGGIAVVATDDASHVICLSDDHGADGPSKPHPLKGYLACCTAAQALGAAGAPVPASVAIVWPLRRAFTVAWRPEMATAPRAPPGVSASARAPPVV